MDHTWTAMFFRKCSEEGFDRTTMLWKFTQVNDQEFIIQRVDRNLSPQQCLRVLENPFSPRYSIGIQNCSPTDNTPFHRWTMTSYP